MFWSALEAETEDWFMWFSQRVKMDGKKLAREIGRGGGGISQEVLAEIVKLAGKNFHAPFQNSTARPLLQPMSSHTGVEEDEEMDEAPKNDVEFIGEASAEPKQFLVSYPQDEGKGEIQAANPEYNNNNNNINNNNNNNTEKRQKAERKPRPPGAPRSAHPHKKGDRPAGPPPTNLTIHFSGDGALPQYNPPESILQKVKAMEAKHGRHCVTPSEPGVHLISSAEKKSMEDEGEEGNSERDRYILIKHFKDWKRVLLSAEEYKLSQKYGEDFVLYVITKEDITVFEDIQSLATWMSFPASWDDQCERHLIGRPLPQ